MDFNDGPGGTTAGAGAGAGAVAKTDQTLSNGSGSRAWADPRLTRARLGLPPSPSPSRSPPSAFLAPAFDACASDTSDMDPTLLRLTRSHHLLRYSSPPPEKPPPGARSLLQMKSLIGSGKLPPLPPLKSPASYKGTPMRMAGMEEDVLVMDGVLVTDARPNIRRNNLADYGSSGNSSGSGSGVFFKPDLGRGKDDLRGPRSWKQKNEVVGTKLSAGSGKYSSRLSRYISLPGPNTGDSGLTKKTVTKLVEIAPTAAAPVASMPLPSSTFTWPPTAEMDALIKQKLYGPSSRRRLPIFLQICAQPQ